MGFEQAFVKEALGGDSALGAIQFVLNCSGSFEYFVGEEHQQRHIGREDTQLPSRPATQATSSHIF